jgi:hypothetical protein
VQEEVAEEAAVRAARGTRLTASVAILAFAVAATVAWTPAGSADEVAQKGNLRVTFKGDIAPRRLPRVGVAPIGVEIGGLVSTTDGSEPPQLERVVIAINRHGRLDLRGLPKCRFSDVQPSTTQNAMRACGASKVGHGTFSASVSVPGQTPFPAEGKMVAFNGVYEGQPAILAHVYGTNPVPTSYTLPFVISHAKGTFSTVLTGLLPKVTGRAGFITGIELSLQRRFRAAGEARSYLSAGCPAPKGFPGAVFPLARASFSFAGRGTLSSVLVRNCKAR